MAALQAVLFDFDDTLSGELVSFEKALLTVFHSLLSDRRLEFEPVRDRVFDLCRKEWRCSAHWRKSYSLSVGWSEIFSGGFVSGEAGRQLEAESERIRPLIWRRVLLENGISDEPLLARLCKASQEEATGQHSPYPGAHESVKELAKRYPLALVTNGNPDIQRRKLTRSGLEEFFTCVVVSGDVGVQAPKPDPAPFRHALSEIEVDAANAVMIGNDVVNDIHGAANLGMKTVWVNLEMAAFDGPRQPDHEISNLKQLPSVIYSLA